MGPGAAGPGPGHAGGGAGPAAGLAAALGSLAEDSGLGMFREFLNFDDSEFWKGALVGAAVTLLLTNEGLRESLIGGAMKTAEAVKAGFDGTGTEAHGTEGEAAGAGGNPAASPGEEESEE